MKHEISALMDGELFEDEVESLLDQLKGDASARKNWAAYHLIGDVLRQPDHIHCDLSAKVRARMQNEPTVFSPRVHTVNQKMRAVALSAAASVSAIGVVVWMSLQVGPETSTTIAMKQSLMRPVNAKIQAKSNDYLMAHQEFSPSTDMSGRAYYMRTVSYGAEVAKTKVFPGEK